MITSYQPNRKHLMELDEYIKTSRMGKDILKRKMDVLVISFLDTVKRRDYQRARLEDIMEKGLKDILFLETRIGAHNLRMRSFNDDKIILEERKKNIMGLALDIFSINIERSQYFSDGPLDLDKAKEMFVQILKETIDLGAVENNIMYMGKEIGKIRKITGSLENYLIPHLLNERKRVYERIEEMEREDILRYKMMKKKIGLL